MMNPIQLAATIDHTILRPEAKREEITRLCEEARKYSFAAVCLNPFYVPYAVRLLSGAPVAVAAVAGFPLGANTTATKAFEAGEAAQNGATEIDMVINVAALKDGMTRTVSEDISRVRTATAGCLLKVILETGLLSEEEKRLAARIAADSGADMLKTSTGFFGGATEEDVRLLKEVAPHLGIKASGGIRNAESALRLIAAGATRLGTSSAVAILRELEAKGGE
jgi:deoxyribose-phosphate aldolase